MRPDPIANCPVFDRHSAIDACSSIKRPCWKTAKGGFPTYLVIWKVSYSTLPAGRADGRDAPRAELGLKPETRHSRG
jgi:hypothetical protein